MAESLGFTEIVVDAAGRRIFVLDDVLAADAVEAVHEHLRGIPVSLTDSDRPDTDAYKHLKHDFVRPGEACEEPFAIALIQLARQFLDKQGIATGALYRV